MRLFLIAAASGIMLAVLLGNAHAVGRYVVGKEDCACAPLITKGKVPDTLNKLHHALYFPSLGRAVDRIAAEVKAILNQFGIKTGPHVAGPQISPAPGVTKLKPRKKRKKRRIKLPKRAT
ncbi:hypothetical protein ACFL2Q_01250 [Thermodesulfobacteriota bacterium]